MKSVLLVKNTFREGPGLLEAILEDENITFDTVDLDAGEAFPDAAGYHAVVVFGGPDSVNDATGKMTAELARVRAAIDAGIPYLGICLGLQVAVKAAGGSVVVGNVKEIGFLDMNGRQNSVRQTAAGKADPLLKGLAEDLPVFQLHGETVELAGGMELLATGEFCKNQIVKVADKAYGIQSHFELTPEMLAEWAVEDPDLRPLGKAKLLAQFEAVRNDYTRTGKTLMLNFLRVAGLIS